MTSGPVLLKTLLIALAAHGLAAETVTPWRGWVVFKDYVRSVAEVPDPGVSVQITRDDRDETVSLIFLRQVDAPSFDRFADIVESSVDFQKLALSKPLGSSVYWIET
jgi:hypothetical protein